MTKNDITLSEINVDIDKLWVSFCNQVGVGNLFLNIINLKKTTTKWIDLSLAQESSKQIFTGICGLACFKDYVVIAFQSMPAIIALVRAIDGKIVTSKILNHCKDAHSVVVVLNYAYIVSTATNEIYSIKIDGDAFGEEELFWRYPEVDNNKDMVHLNGLTFDHGKFIASCFGSRDNEGLWGNNGRIFYLDSGQDIASGLSQPHTPTINGDQLFFAESKQGKLYTYTRAYQNTWKFDNVIDLPGYPRGIAVRNNKLIVALSRSRNISRSQPDSLSYENIDFLDSKLLEVCLLTKQFKQILDCTALGFEIYDLCFIDLDLFRNQDSYEEIKNNPATPAICVKMYDLLNSIVLDKFFLESNEFNAQWAEIISEYHNFLVENALYVREELDIKSSLEKKIQEQEKHISEQKELMDSLLSSRSWRLTARLQKIYYYFKRIR